jgi:hypothetical protein
MAYGERSNLVRNVRNWAAWCVGVLVCAIVAGRVSAQSLQSDDFGGTTLKTFWKVNNTDKSPWSLKDGWLVSKAGFNQNVWDADTSTRWWQPTDKDFDVETTMIADYKDACTVAGIIAYSAKTKDHQNRDGQWVTLKLWGRGADQGNNAVLQYQRREDDAAAGYVGTQPNYNPKQGVIPVALRVKRTGNDYEAWFKPDAKGDWVRVSKVTNALANPLEVGIYVGICQGAGGSMTVSFDYFKEASSPITAVDPQHAFTVTWGALKAD